MLPDMLHPARPRRLRREGFSVVEVLVALLLVSVGLLAMAGTSSLALRTAHTAAAELRAAHRAALRLELLAGPGCAAPASGVVPAGTGGMRESWTVAAATNGAARVEWTAEWAAPRGVGTLRVESALLC
jgi:Tfp pilus assembly protein PilV